MNSATQGALFIQGAPFSAQTQKLQNMITRHSKYGGTKLVSPFEEIQS